MKRAFKVKSKAFFIIFKGFLEVKNFLRPQSAPLRYLEAPKQAHLRIKKVS